MSVTLGLVISPTAGTGRGVTVGREATHRLTAAGVHIIPLGAPSIEETNWLIGRAIRDRMIDGIVTVGGDGTVHLAIQHLVGTDLFLGHIPFGTGNDIARDLGLTTKWESGLDHLIGALGREPTELDVMEIAGGHGTVYGLAIVSAGLDAIVNQRANHYTRPHGHARYLRALAAKLPGYRPRTYRLEVGGKTNTAKAVVVAVANLQSFGGGLTLSPDSDGTDGVLELVVAKPLSLAEFGAIFPKVYDGTHLESDFVHVHQAEKVLIDTVGEGVTAMVDGEEIGPLPVTVSVRPRALRFLR